MAIKTNITIAELMRLNKWIKSKEQATKILNDVKTKPSFSLVIGDKVGKGKLNKGTK